MFIIEMKSAPGYARHPSNIASNEWDIVGISVAGSTVDTVEEGIEAIRELWDFDRESDGVNMVQYRLRRVADNYVVFTKGA